MNPIDYILNRIKFAIPPEVLNIAFIEYSRYTNNMISLDEHIMNLVIRPIVMRDANIVGGIETVIAINNCGITYLPNREFIIDIPKELTEGRSILNVKSLVSNVIYSQATSYNDMSSALSSSMNMMNNMGSENVVQTSKLEIIADNTVLVADPTIHLMDGMLRCDIENMNNLENINPRSYDHLSEMCILAVKAWIYNHLVIKLDKGYIYSGTELGVVTDIINGYSDAFENYLEFLRMKWAKMAFMNNSSNTMNRYIKSMISNTI